MGLGNVMNAPMLELVDRLASEVSVRNDVGVRISLGAHDELQLSLDFLFPIYFNLTIIYSVKLLMI